MEMGKKILVVEDSRNFVKGLKMALEAKGYRVNVAGDGVQAMERVFSFKPDLVLLDLLVPKLDGFVVLESLKREDRTRSIPVVVISAKADEEDIKKARKLGAADYLVKPFTPRELAGALEKVLG